MFSSVLVNFTKARHGRVYRSGCRSVYTAGHKEKHGQPILTFRKEGRSGKTENLGSGDNTVSWECAT